MGFPFTGEPIKNKRICSNHFTADAYLNLVTRRLRKDAVPIPFVGGPSTSTAHVRPHLIECTTDRSLVPLVGEGSYCRLVKFILL